MKPPGLSGKSTDFNKGDLRQRNVKLYYLDPNTNNMCPVDRPQHSGNPLIDQIGLFAYSHGIDPAMFTNRDSEVAHQSLEKLTQSFGPKMNPRHARHGSRFSETQSVNASRFMPVAQAQESIPELMNNEIKEIRRFLHEKQFQSPFQQADAYQRPSNDFVQHRPPTLARRLTESRQSNAARPGLTPWCSDVQENIVTMLKDETVKNKTQIAILSLSLNRYLNNQDRLKIYQINKQIRILEQHESKVQEIMTMFQVIKKELHFAFLFASPIVI